jgi:mono/diheme cytochrome c family protein
MTIEPHNPGMTEVHEYCYTIVEPGLKRHRTFATAVSDNRWLDFLRESIARMRIRSLVSSFVLFGVALSVLVVRASGERVLADDTKIAASDRKVASDGPEAAHALLSQYCIKCHGEKGKPKGGFDLVALMKKPQDAESLEKWDRARELIAGGEMPPPKQAKPSAEEVDRLLAWLDGKLAKAGCESPRKDSIAVRRMNRAEYNNTIRDLIGIDFHPADDFPSDDVGYGFDNIGDLLTLPPLLMEKYLAAAETITDRAVVADARLEIPVRRFEAEKLPKNAGGEAYEDDARILASEGAITTRFNPANNPSDYLLRARVWGQQAGDQPVRIELRVDGKSVHTADVTATENSPIVVEKTVRLRPGRRELAVAFVNDFYDPENADAKRRDRNLIVDWIEIKGPLGADRAVPESHKRIFFVPTPTGDWRPAARQIIERFATRAYRRPLRPAELDRLVRLVEAPINGGERFERGVQLGVQAVLASPSFLFRFEGKPPADSNPIVRQYTLASRLSYFLWSTMPDDELFELARKGELDNDATLEAQVQRMLKNPKAGAFVENFVDQWLTLRILRVVSPDPKAFPSFNDALRGSMLRETEMFAESILREDRNLLEFLDADYTFLNERLAKHYGIDGVEGDHFRRVTLPKGSPRGGLLTQASLLTVTSNPTRTSPVKRGKWILEQILGTPPPPPPPDVPELSDAKNAVLSGSLRQRMEQHRADPNCATCHQRMDPLGFGFENFNAVGAWRDKDGDFPIDPSGVLPSGQRFQGPVELKTVLKQKRQEFVRCLAEKMMTYALGRGMEIHDRCAIDQIVEAVERGDFRSSRLIVTIVQSDEFRMRTGEGDKR